MKKIKKIGMYAFLSIAAFVSLFPFIWMIVSTTNRSIDITRGRLFPGNYFIENLSNLIERTDLVNAFYNSAMIAIVTTVLALFFSSLAGYGFEIYRSKARDRVFSLLLASMMVPFTAIMIPLFRMFADISRHFPALGLNTPAAVILPSITTAFLIFFFRQNAKMFSKELLDAGRIDGLTEFGLFIKVFVPTMKSTYATAAIIAFMGNWNNFLWPLIVLRTPEHQTLPLLISIVNSGTNPDFGVAMLAVVIATLPIAIVFFVFQRYFVAGMTGSIK